MRKIGFRAESEEGGKAAIVVEWPLHWSEDKALNFAAQLYVQMGAKIAENYT